MNKFMQDFIKRNLPQFEDNFDIIITNEKRKIQSHSKRRSCYC